jgi:hypothetical protein
MNIENNYDLANAIYMADWYYAHSDDYGAYKRGENQVRELTDFIKNIEWSNEKREDLWKSLESLIIETSNGREINPKHKEFWFNKIKQLTDWNDNND